MTSRVTALLIVSCLAAPIAAQSRRPGGTPPDDVLQFTRAARSVQPGEIVVVTIAAPTGTEALEASAFGRALDPFHVQDGTWRALVGIDLETAPGTYPLVARAYRAGGVTERSYSLPVAAKRFPTRRLTVDDRYVEPPPDVVARIQEEAALLAGL